jgi:hypothetical protein
MPHPGGRRAGGHEKVHWHMPSDLVAIIRQEAIRLDVGPGRLVTQMLRERLAQPRPVEIFSRERGSDH